MSVCGESLPRDSLELVLGWQIELEVLSDFEPPKRPTEVALPGAFGLWREAAGLVLARMAADEAEILTFGVAPNARRRGHGAALLRGAVDGARARGAGAMFLEVAAGNAPALALYAREGFAEVGRRRRYYSDGADALVLRRDLAAAGGQGRR